MLEEYVVRHFHYSNAKLELHTRVAMTGHELREGREYAWNGMKRGRNRFILWQYTLAGCGYLRYGEREYRIRPGEAMLVDIPTDHFYCVDERAGRWDFCFIILSGEESWRIGCEAIRGHGPHFDATMLEKVLPAARAILETDENNFDTLSMAVNAYRFLLDLAGVAILSRDGVPAPLLAARRLALRRFDAPVTVDDMAEAAQMSYAHFIRRYVQFFGESPGAFLHRLQLEKAANLLLNTDYPLERIARLSGFSSAGYLCRAFRNARGCSPGAFRGSNPLRAHREDGGVIPPS